MKTITNDHDAVLAAIAEASEKCGREVQSTPAAPPSVPARQPQAGIPFYQPQDQAAPAATSGHPAFQPQQSPPAQQQVTQPVAQNGRPVIEGEGPSDEEMREVFDERKKKKFKLGLVINMTLLALFVTPCLAFTGWYHASPKNKESFAELMQNFREVPNDVKSMATIKESYDEALGEIGARGDTINAATLALGVDPSEFEEAAAAENDDAAFLSEHAGRTAVNN